jgi:hypothetical protein
MGATAWDSLLHGRGGVAIDGGGGGEHEALHTGIARGDEQGERGVEVVAVGLDRLRDGERDGGLRGFVENPVAAGDELFHQRFIGHFALHEVEFVAGLFPVEVADIAGAEVVEDDDLRAAAAERFANV